MKQRIKSARRSDDISLVNSFVLVEDSRNGKQFRIPCDKFINNGGGKRVYKALLTQAGAAAPTAVVLENTIGDITWSYGGSSGYYIGTLNGAFPSGKTSFILGQKSNLTIGVIQIQEIDNNSFGLFISSDYVGGFAVGNNDALYQTSILIEVYD